MKTFKLGLALETRVVVPEQFLKEMREASLDPEATPFMKQLAARELDDETFLIAILKSGIRHTVRQSLLDLYYYSQPRLGGSVAPPSVSVEDMDLDEITDLLQKVAPKDAEAPATPHLQLVSNPENKE